MVVMTGTGEGAVVAVIVTSAEGVLAGRRRDGMPGWTFPGGGIEPGETAQEAAVREVREETGLLVRAGPVLGKRMRPLTRRAMVYVAAQPVSGADVAATDELAEVRWLSLAGMEELMPGIHEPVREYLRRVL
jgi:8-oxo-dGTP pyrophosphatase MutT (NUDIX family)